MKRWLFSLTVLLGIFVYNIGLMPVSVLALDPISPATAAEQQDVSSSSASGGTISDACAQAGGNSSYICSQASSTLESRLPKLINLLLFIVASSAVIMIIVGAIRYATSGGSADKLKKAKTTIVSALIGLVFALSALAIVNFVKNQTQKLGATTWSQQI